MSAHRLIVKRQKNRSLSASSLIGGLLLAFLAWLSLLFSVWAAPLLSPQNVTRAGVSVVRLIVSYTNASSDATSSTDTSEGTCTGLGVIVSSLPTPNVSNRYTNYVLTGNALLQPGTSTSCQAAKHLETTVSGVDIYTSTEYNSQTPVHFFVANSALQEQCTARFACPAGLELFAFSSDLPQPFIDLAAQSSSQDQAVVLTASSSDLALPKIDYNTDPKHNPAWQSFRSPATLPQNSSLLEDGTPLVNSIGDLAGLHILSKTLSISELQSVLAPITSMSSLISANKLHENWKNGMDAYYTITSNDAHSLFLAAAVANPQFLAARTYANLTAHLPAAATSSAGSAPLTFSHDGFSVAGFSIPYWQLGIVGLLALLVVLLLASLFFGRSRSQRKIALDAELAEADRRATIEAQHIAELEAAQYTKNVPAQSVFKNASAPAQLLPTPALHCPRCRELVAADANYCSNCRLVLSPSESGLHLRVRKPELAAPAISPVAPASTPLAPPPPPPLQPRVNAASANSIAEQPTLVPANALSEQPTADIAPSVDPDKTAPFALQHLKGHHLSFVAGTRSDPGIKRKYRPNEDSLFAAQGHLQGPAVSPLFGLFVVADGMGGHAKGEDASQLAIQNIIDYVLPRLLHSDTSQRDAYVQLLVDGVQAANQAVHQNNLEQRGDMGTTVTAAMVVENTAYVANVGDSRTYLYRESEGLKKVTNDHSVVASLVEAGIIKPDDIYTHPKRNQIYRSLGEKAAVEIDSFVVQLQEGDKLLLCSDGLWDMVRDPKIEELIKNPVRNPASTGDALIQEALTSGGEDNVSVIVVHITEAANANGVPRIQLLAKPDSVQMPQL